MRTVAAAAAVGLVLNGATVLTPVAVAAPHTCHGLPVTISGIPGERVTGTNGPDVIVSNRAYQVDALGGDDIICVTGRTSNRPRPFVDAGPGDDLVDTTDARVPHVATQLGAGADTFVGGRVVDQVQDGSPLDAGVDHIDTGGGADTLTSGSVGQVNGDRLRGGRGDDLFRVRGLLQQPDQLAPGGQHNRLNVGDSGAAETNIDLAARTVEMDGITLVSWRGRIDQLRINGRHDPDQTINFSGTGGADELALGWASSPVVHAHLRGGNDRLEAEFNGFAPGSNFSAGPGADTFLVNVRRYPSGVLEPWLGNVDLDLDAHHVGVEGVDGVAQPTSGTIHGFSRVLAGGRGSLTVAGDEQDNTVIAVSCNIDVDGRGGADSLRARVPDRCRGEGNRRLVGGGGDDRLVGSGLDDVLIGGRGRDIAVGSGGTDTCRAEVTRTCEPS